ncbi:hypothetical protein [Streptomyces sp. NPDC088736]|uniref:hypothetical protein n=1 Tax=Streptomyces sp. NPDC088736 TaxID=3365881 RepID=UPI00382BBA22
MSEQSAEEDLPGAGDAEETQSGDAGAQESPAVAAAASRIEAARIARSAATRKELAIASPFLAACIFGGEIFILSISHHDTPSGPLTLLIWMLKLVILLLIILAVLAVRVANRRATFEEVCRVEEFNIVAAGLNYDQKPDAPLAANRALLREYHRLSTNQAKSAFRLAQWVMGASALLVSAGAVAVGLASKTATAVTLASLTAFVTALSGYISSTLLATYRVSVEQARFYFREPLAGGYLLAAEHLADSLDGPSDPQPSDASSTASSLRAFSEAGRRIEIDQAYLARKLDVSRPTVTAALPRDHRRHGTRRAPERPGLRRAVSRSRPDVPRPTCPKTASTRAAEEHRHATPWSAARGWLGISRGIRCRAGPL